MLSLHVNIKWSSSSPKSFIIKSKNVRANFGKTQTTSTRHNKLPHKRSHTSRENDALKLYNFDEVCTTEKKRKVGLL